MEYNTKVKLSCDSRFQRAFTAIVCVFDVITLVGSNQRNYFENMCCNQLKITMKLCLASHKILQDFLAILG